MTTKVDSRIEKLRKIADSLQSKADQKNADRRENTPKQQREASFARYEGHNLQVAANAANALADFYERGLDHPSYGQDYLRLLHKFNNGKAIQDATKCKSHVGPGYYDCCFPKSDEFYDMSPEAVALRKLLFKDNQDSAAISKDLKLKQLIANMRNADIPGFFPTPDGIIELMLSKVSHQLPDMPVFLEPSAGIGSIADKIVHDYPNAVVVCVERNYSLAEILELKGYATAREDFLEVDPQPLFDRILMNPPFENDQAIDHVKHAFKFLKEDDKLTTGLVAIMPGSPSMYEDAVKKKRKDFYNWLLDVSYEWEPLPEGAFKDAFRSTGVSTSILTIWK